MKYRRIHIIILSIAASSLLLSCSYSRKFTHTYYQENDSMFQLIKTNYKKLERQHPFSLAIKDRAYRNIGFEIITDTIRYVYNFNISEPRFLDTLNKYQFDTNGVLNLIHDMQATHCTWITNLDYYENRQAKYLVFLSIRHRKLKSFMRAEKYFTLAFFDQPQHYDMRGRLLDNQDQKSLHRINGGLFRKIDNRVCYSLSANFR